MAAEYAFEHEIPAEYIPVLELVVDNTKRPQDDTRFKADVDHMASSELCTWPTHPETPHAYRPEAGVLSYRESDGARDGRPVRLYGDTALHALGRKA